MHYTNSSNSCKRDALTEQKPISPTVLGCSVTSPSLVVYKLGIRAACQSNLSIKPVNQLSIIVTPPITVLLIRRHLL
jgi:hypothetical protein